MESKHTRVLGRALAVEETQSVAGARPTAPTADTRYDVNGNPDTTPTQDSGPSADPTNPLIDVFDPNR